MHVNHENVSSNGNMTQQTAILIHITLVVDLCHAEATLLDPMQSFHVLSAIGRSRAGAQTIANLPD